MTVLDLTRLKATSTKSVIQNDPAQWSLNNSAFLGLAQIVRRAYEGNNLEFEFQNLKLRLSANYQDADALMDVALILLVNQQNDRALPIQKLATRIQKNYELRFGNGSDLRVLVIVTTGDLMANMPIEFLLEQTNVLLTYHFVDSETSDLKDVPTHDVAFLAIGQSSENENVLKNMHKLLESWKKPLINGRPERIRELTRSGVFQLLSSEKSIVAVPCAEYSRPQLLKCEFLIKCWQYNSSKINTPFIVRPAGTHAGKGMQKIDDLSQLDTYLAEHNEPSYYVCPFIDYRSADGFYRKQRIVFINGHPFPSHQATSTNWMVHYLNADMEQFEERRLDEASWFANFQGFADRHKTAMKALSTRISLDYFAIDCAETSDGKLLIFEVDVAMIVHALDSEVLFPYKKRAMTRLTKGFLDFLRARSKFQSPTVNHAVL